MPAGFFDHLSHPSWKLSLCSIFHHNCSILSSSALNSLSSDKSIVYFQFTNSMGQTLVYQLTDINGLRPFVLFGPNHISHQQTTLTHQKHPTTLSDTRTPKQKCAPTPPTPPLLTPSFLVVVSTLFLPVVCAICLYAGTPTTRDGTALSAVFLLTTKVLQYPDLTRTRWRGRTRIEIDWDRSVEEEFKIKEVTHGRSGWMLFLRFLRCPFLL